MRRDSIDGTSAFSLAIAQLLSICASILSFCTLILPAWVTVTTSDQVENYGLFFTCRNWKNCSSDLAELYRSEARNWWIPALLFELMGFILTVVCAFTVVAIFAHASKFQALKFIYIASSISAAIFLVTGVMIPVGVSNYDFQMIPGVKHDIHFSWGLILAIGAAGSIIMSLFFIVLPKPKEVSQPRAKMSLPSLAIIRGLTSLKSSVVYERNPFRATPYESPDAAKK